MTTTKRFIAGAVCPSCGEMDTLMMYQGSPGKQNRECVECQFRDVLDSKLSLQGGLPEARISREEKILEDDVEIVRIIDASETVG